MSSKINSALDYSYILICIVLIVPILANWIVVYIIVLTGAMADITSALLTFVTLAILKTALKYDYPEVFENFFLFLIAVTLSGVFLYILRDMLGMGILTVISTLIGLFVAYIGFKRIIAFVTGGRLFEDEYY